METIEEFFKNRIVFLPLSVENIYADYPRLNNPPTYHPIPTPRAYLSKNIFTPEEYTPELAKEKVKAFAYYLFSSLKFYQREVFRWGMHIKFFYFNGGYDDNYNYFIHFNNAQVKDIVYVGLIFFDVEFTGGSCDENDFFKIV